MSQVSNIQYMKKHQTLILYTNIGKKSTVSRAQSSK